MISYFKLILELTFPNFRIENNENKKCTQGWNKF